MSKHLAEHVAWCENMFRMLADNGTWAVPRSGLVFQKRGKELVLTGIMPWVEEMPISDVELLEQQAGDYEAIREHFAAAGVVVQLGQGISFT